MSLDTNATTTTDVESSGLGGFLVLSRERHQEVRIGENITVRVMEIRGDKVRIGFRAPTSVVIDRLEVVQAKERKKHDAVTG